MASTTTTILKCISQSTQQIWKSIALSAAEDLLQNVPLHIMLLFIRIYDLIVRNALSITTLKKNLLDTGMDNMVQDIKHSVENSLTSGLEGIKNTKKNARNVVFKRNLNKRKNFLAWRELINCLCLIYELHCSFFEMWLQLSVWCFTVSKHFTVCLFLCTVQYRCVWCVTVSQHFTVCLFSWTVQMSLVFSVLKLQTTLCLTHTQRLLFIVIKFHYLCFIHNTVCNLSYHDNKLFFSRNWLSKFGTLFA